MDTNKNILLALTGATGAFTTELLMESSPWPVSLIASKLGRKVYEHERGPFKTLTGKAAEVYDNDDLFAPVASGSVETAGMVILPCSANTLGKIAAGLGDSLITRSAHCHLKEKRPLILCLRETPLTLIDLKNAVKASEAGAIIMPISPPFYMNQSPETVTLKQTMSAYIDRVLSLLGRPAERTWEDVR